MRARGPRGGGCRGPAAPTDRGGRARGTYGAGGRARGRRHGTAGRPKKHERPMSVSSQDKQRAKRQEKRQEGGAAETVRVVIHALIIAFVIRTFLLQPFNLPSGSMMATLLIGDYLFVSKYSYGYSHYSLPLSPRIFSGRVIGSTPERGDVVVFRLPND